MFELQDSYAHATLRISQILLLKARSKDPAALISLVSLLPMKNLWSLPRPTESETILMRPKVYHMHYFNWLNFSSVLGYYYLQGSFFSKYVPRKMMGIAFLPCPMSVFLCLMISAHESVFLMEARLSLGCVRERNRSEGALGWLSH